MLDLTAFGLMLDASGFILIRVPNRVRILDPVYYNLCRGANKLKNGGNIKDLNKLEIILLRRMIERYDFSRNSLNYNQPSGDPYFRIPDEIERDIASVDYEINSQDVKRRYREGQTEWMYKLGFWLVLIGSLFIFLDQVPVFG